MVKLPCERRGAPQRWGLGHTGARVDRPATPGGGGPSGGLHACAGQDAPYRPATPSLSWLGARLSAAPQRVPGTVTAGCSGGSVARSALRRRAANVHPSGGAKRRAPAS